MSNSLEAIEVALPETVLLGVTVPAVTVPALALPALALPAALKPGAMDRSLESAVMVGAR